MTPPENFAALTTLLHNRAVKRDDLLELGRFAEAEALQREQLHDEVELARWITAVADAPVGEHDPDRPYKKGRPYPTLESLAVANATLAARLEVAESALKAAVGTAQWQASTNGELNALAARCGELERDAERHAETRGLVRDLTTVLEKRNREVARLRSALVSLVEAYSNIHSPQHRSACLSEARTAVALASQAEGERG